MFLLCYIDVLFVPREDSINLIFTYSVVSDQLLFRRIDNGYKASYTFESEIFLNGKLYSSVMKPHELIMDFPHDEKLRKNHYFVKTLPYGRYRIVSYIKDATASSILESDTTFIDASQDGSMVVGSILNVVSLDSLEFSYKREYSDEETIYLILPIYSRIEDTITLHIYAVGRRYRTPKIEVTYALRKGMNELRIDYDIDKLKFDEYTLHIDVIHKRRKLVSRTLVFRKVGFMNLSEYELKALISALEFVYPGEFNRYLSKAEGNFSKAWKEFWKDKDPTPNTEENEYMKVFMERFTYALYNFYRLGRIMDMGLIYIKYGPPDYIEKNEMLLEGKSYQIWYYNSINKRFIFVDRYGTGEYELVPTALYNDF